MKGDLSNAELAEWLTGAEYDDELSQSERDELVRISLVLIEVQEGSRDRAQLLNAVAELLASTSSGRPVLAARSGSDTTWSSEPTLTATPARFQRVGI
jgi:hypothetical protein